MDLFAKLEKLSEKYIEGLFRRKTAGRIQPVEIAQQLAREMRDNKTVSLSKTYVPNRYKIYLGEKDWDDLNVFITSLSQEMQEFIIKKSREKDYALVSLPVIEFAVDKSLTKGNFRIDSKFSDDPVTGEPMENTLVAMKKSDMARINSDLADETMVRKAPEPPKAELVIISAENEGFSYNLGEKTVIIGRKRECEIFLDDSNVSRRHARIEAVMGEYFITDLDSTNGTLVNGVRITKKRLEPNDTIKVGTTLLEYRVV